MKNKKKEIIDLILMCLEFILIIIDFIYLWHFKEIYSKLWVLKMIPDIILIIINILIGCYAVIRIYDNKKSITNYITIFIFFLSVIFIVSPLNYFRAKYEFNINKSDYEEVIEQIEKEQLTMDEDNLISLDSKYCNLSYDCNVRVDNNNLVVSFEFWTGAPGGGGLIVYSSKGDELIYSSIEYIIYLKEINSSWYYVEID